MTGYIRKCQRDFLKNKGVAVQIVDLDKPQGKPVVARIWQSQWIATCECNTAMFVDPDEPIFFCFGCGNRLNGKRPRPVIFPPTAERKEIERLLLERPVEDVAGLTDLERVGLQKPLLEVQVEEVDEQAVMTAAMRNPDALKRSNFEMPTRVVLKPLTRSWEPGETPADLERQQRDAIKRWRQELKHGI